MGNQTHPGREAAVGARPLLPFPLRSTRLRPSAFLKIVFSASGTGLAGVIRSGRPSACR
ncbi:hypothetical protein VXQ18_13350 [Brucella abortus]|nr:hypothetical protein [Brucella abortus]